MPDESVDPRVDSSERGRRFEPEAQSVRHARDFTATVLRDAGYDGDPDTVLLLASELVTNAVRHAATPFDVEVDVNGPNVRVAVTDHDPDHLPEVRDPGPDDTSGRGLIIVDQLAAQWGSEPIGPSRKAVWFTLS